MADLIKAERKINKVLMRWYSDDTVMLGAWCIVKKEACKIQSTMGIDSRCRPPKIRYNPNFVNSLSIEQLETVMVSEGFKLLLRHPTSRMKNPKQINNLASTITVNSVMNYMPGNEHMLQPDKFDLEPNKYHEYYFRKLKENSDSVNQKISQIYSKMSDEEKQNAVDNAQKQIEKEQEQQEQNKDDDGYKNEDNTLKDYYNPGGSSNEFWGENLEVEAAIKNYIQKNKGNMYGKHTGHAEGLIIAANKPKITWKEVLRRFNTSVVVGTSIPTRKKSNRRHDLNMPGCRRSYHSRIIFAIDVSGSMSDEDVTEGFTVVNSICKHSSLDYLLFDTDIKRIEKNYKIVRNNLDISGRGGTNFDKVIEYADNNRCDGLIIFSDMMAPPPPKPKKVKVLWLSHTKGQKPPVDWGMTAELNRYE